MIISVIICFLLILLSYQDFRYRAISWWLIPLLFVFLAYNNIKNTSFELVLQNLFLNLSFVLIQIGLLFLYFSIKNKRFINIIDTYIGIGDLLFFLVLAVSFSFFNYIFFQVISLTLVAFFFGVFKLLKKVLNPEIPLAGGMSLLFFICFILGNKYKISFYNDLLLIAY